MKYGKILYRVLCFILALVFIAISCVSLINIRANAAYDKDMQIRVGIVYGSSVTSSYKITVSNGVSVGIMTDKRTFLKLGEYQNIRTLTVLLEKNTTVGSATVGNWHLQTNNSYTTFKEARSRANYVRSLGIKAYVAYIGGKYLVRCGAYASESDAVSASAALSGKITTTVVSGSGNGTVLYDNDSASIFFECDTSGIYAGIRALQLSGSDNEYYINAPSGYKYNGVFEFAKSGSGIRVVNIVDLDTYTLGVLPWEIIPSWPQETINAFAITARTLAVYHYNARHNSAYGFDVCPTSHCQNYKGMSRDYASFRKAVEQTSGMIATYDGEAIMGIYCGTTGGITEDVRDIWGGNTYYPYLTSVTVPIEAANCENQPKGVWTSTVTPAELSKYFQSSGYTSLNKLTSPITELKVLQYSKYSGVYIYKLQITDSAGHTATVTTSSDVRGALVKYCPSAYFSISYNYNYDVTTASGNTTATLNSSNTTVLTADGEKSLADTTPANLTVQSASGKMTVNTDDYTIQFDGKGNGHGGGISMYGAVDLAKAGYTYDKILKTYFTGISVTSLGSPYIAADYADDGVDDGYDGYEQHDADDQQTSECFDAVSVTQEINLRAQPSTSASVIAQVSTGTVLFRTGITSENWSRVVYDGNVCYACGDYVKTASLPKTSGITYCTPESVKASATVNIRSGASESSAVIGTLKASASITRVGKGSSGFDMVITDTGKIGYIASEYLGDGSAQTDTKTDKYTTVNELVTLTDTVNLRSEPSTSAAIIEVLKKGTVISRIGKGSGEWDKVLTTSGKTAYVKSEYLTTEVSDDGGYTATNQQVVTTTAVNAREEASTSSAIISSLAKGAELTRIAVGDNGWSRVKLSDGKTAYVKSEYLELAANEDPYGKFTAVNDKVTTTDSVNLRKGAGTEYAVLETAAAGTELTRTGIGNNGWDRVLTSSGQTAYVSKTYISEADSGFTAVSDKVKTTVQANLRSKPGTDGEILAVVNSGTELTRTAIGSNGWDKVLTPDGDIAYISQTCIKKSVA